jgi:hypothetical protein
LQRLQKSLNRHFLFEITHPSIKECQECQECQGIVASTVAQKVVAKIVEQGAAYMVVLNIVVKIAEQDAAHMAVLNALAKIAG